MKASLQSQIDDLYKRPLGEFTSARNALARTLSGRDKDAVASLVKPSLAMWAINQLHWTDAAVYSALVDASEKLRTAHRAALNGKDVDTRKPDELHRTTVEKAFAKIVGGAERNGIRLTDPVRDAIRRTLAALPTDEPAGRLTREPPPAGFSLLTGVKPQPIAEPRASKQTARAAAIGDAARTPTKDEIGRRKLEGRRQKQAERKARQQEAEDRKAREKREREIRKAEAALREAERRLAELKR